MTSDTVNLEESNRRFFDDLASEYGMKPWQRDVVARMTRELQEQRAFIGADWVDSTSRKNSSGGEVHLLDYACGTGMATRALAPYLTTATGIDISPKMIEQYKSAATGVPVTAHVGNLCNPAAPTDAALTAPDTFNFDLVILSLGFHHFEHQQLAIDRLTERLAPGGVLLVIDLFDSDARIDPDTEFAKHAKHVMHKWGYSEGEMKEIFETAGLGQFGFHRVEGDLVLMPGEEGEMVRHAFFARGVKPLL